MQLVVFRQWRFSFLFAVRRVGFAIVLISAFFGYVALYRRNIALRRIAMVAAAGGQKRHRLSGPHQKMTELAWKDVFLVVAMDQGCIGRTLFAAQQTPGRALNPIRVPAHEKVMQWFHFDFESNAATKFPRAAAVGA